MLVISLIFEFFSFLLNLTVVGSFFVWLVNGIAWAIFASWFWIKGISYIENPKLLRNFIISYLIGIIPIVNALPEVTVGLSAQILQIRKEDKEYNAKMMAEYSATEKTRKLAGEQSQSEDGEMANE